MSEADTAPGYLEDFRVGQCRRWQVPAAATAGRPAASAAFDMAFDVIGDGGTPVDLRWTFGDAGKPGDTTLTGTVTRCRFGAEGTGLVHRHLRLTDRADTVLGEGTAVFSFPAKHSEPLTQHVRTDFCSLPWARELADALTRNEEFVSATRPMDGSIAFRCGDEAVQFRIYKGLVVDVARSTPSGPTFTVAGSELSWLGLMTAPRNDFIARTMAGDFAASGNTHEYLRFTKAVVSAWDCVRELARRDTP
ncbi:hypothetical protein CFN78_26765 [Amycolatopsis antarctica]|uniref:Uncharacterized protein n=1 Tax=Amycolatopsis antarctica TaxID=1854586 RepID=A0A263CVK4_9PSEU|nr:hypothetical protein [Amycolatopsis antarctica]OZM70172.1 hypothetical protein CFN78_26765 [Amycolatopsis antarctica]